MKLSGAVTLIGGAVIALVLPWFSAKPPIDPDPNPDPIKIPTPFPTPTPKYTGTYGTNMPVIFEEWWLRSGDKFAILSGPSLMENDAFRTNLMLTWSGRLKGYFEFYAENGSKLGTFYFDTYQLEPCSEDSCSGYYQLNNVIKMVAPNYTGLFTIKCIPIKGDGKLLIFATSIDNRSSDPTMYSQFRFAGNGDVWSESGRYN